MAIGTTALPPRKPDPSIDAFRSVANTATALCVQVACMTVMSMRLSPTRLHANAITTARWLLSHLTSPDNAKKSLNVLKPPDNHTLESGFYRHSVPLSKIDYVPTGASGDFMRPGAKTKGFLSETEESCLFVAYKMVLSLASYLLSPCKEADVVSAASALLRHYVQKLIHVDKLPGVLKAATRRTEDHLPPEPWRVRHPSQCFPLPEYLPARRVLKWGSEVVDPAKGTLCAERADRAVPMLEIDWVKNHFKEFKDGQDPRRLVDDAWDKELGLYITAVRERPAGWNWCFGINWSLFFDWTKPCSRMRVPGSGDSKKRILTAVLHAPTDPPLVTVLDPLQPHPCSTPGARAYRKRTRSCPRM